MNAVEDADDPRREVLARYRRFEISREQTDDEARALGLNSLEFRPDLQGYDPLAEPFWTLPMALAWIIYRRADPVRCLIMSYRAESLVWRFAGRFRSKAAPPKECLNFCHLSHQIISTL